MKSEYLSRFKSKFGLRGWPSYDIAKQLKMHNCVEVLDYIKNLAGIPLEQAIWDVEKIRKLVRSTIKRKIFFSLTFAAMWLCLFLATCSLIFILSCILREEACNTQTLKNGRLWLGAASLSAAGLFLLTQNIGRDTRNESFIDYLSPNLTPQQKLNIIEVINELKKKELALYEASNYEVIRNIPAISWRAENWFLLLTENEKDRLAIWLDGQYPLGQLLIKKSSKRGKKSITGSVWDKIELPNMRLLFSSKERLNNYITSMQQGTLNKDQKNWYEGTQVLLENHTVYHKYLDGKLDSKNRDDFYSKFTPIFARQSKKYESQLKTLGLKKMDLSTLGENGTSRFLHGKNENIERWVKNNLPKSINVNLGK